MPEENRDPELERIHDSGSSHNRYAISGSALAGCYYCCKIWEPAGTKIAEFCDIDTEAPDGLGNATALCPFCGIDSVLASIDVHPITMELLQDMSEYWFSTS